jgi:hypothetical protein
MATKAEVHRDKDLKDGTQLRRYLDLPKYIALLRSSSVYLRRADRFTDRFEGALTPAIRKAIDSARAEDCGAESAEVFYRRCRMGTFVSCWTLGAKDNMALWQLYGGASTSVAVNTTVRRLTSVCLTWGELVLLQKVRYIDHFENPNMVIGRYSDPLLRIPTIVTDCTDDRDRWVSADAWCSNSTPVGHDDRAQGCP